MVVNWCSFATDGVLENVPPLLPPLITLPRLQWMLQSRWHLSFFLWPRQKLFSEMDYHISDVKLQDKKWTDIYIFFCLKKKIVWRQAVGLKSLWKMTLVSSESVFFKGQRTVSSSIEKILDLFSTRQGLEKKKYSFCVSFSFFCQLLDVFPYVNLISWGLYVLSLNVILFTRSSRSTVWQRSNTWPLAGSLRAKLQWLRGFILSLLLLCLLISRVSWVN